jgi:transposase
MNTNKSINTPEVRAGQVTNTLPEAIYLGVDLHKQSIWITRIIDHSTAQPAQQFGWESFWRFVARQLTLAKKVYAVYEAGAFGFWPARRLRALGVEGYVVHPEKLDPRHKRVQTDRLDSRHLAENLQRYVQGNRRAMVPVYVPTQSEERQRLQARHRRKLHEERHRLQVRGQGLLLSQGIFQTRGWWRSPRWEQLQPQLSPELATILADDRALLLEVDQRLRAVEKTLAQAAPAQRPKGFGRLSFVLLLRELCNYRRFHNRRNVGGFTGLCGAVSGSGDYHLDLSINKAGNPYLRALLVELAWRMVYWQPAYKPLQRWKHVFEPGGAKRQRKIAIVALAHQLMVDLWRWQTGQTTPQQLGWQMAAA